mgnify:CR=1 FL=1
MSSLKNTARHTSDFVQLLQEFLAASSAMRDLLENSAGSELQLERVAAVVGDDEGSVLYRLKEQSHSLFRSEVLASAAVRREALFDLTIGSLFHEAMKLRGICSSFHRLRFFCPALVAFSAAGVVSGQEGAARLPELPSGFYEAAATVIGAGEEPGLGALDLTLSLQTF